MVLVVEGELPDLVSLRVVLTAEGQHLHSLMDNNLAVSACSDVVHVVEVGRFPADAALLRRQAGVQVILDIIEMCIRDRCVTMPFDAFSCSFVRDT